MKRITAIELHNFLAFYGTDNKISLPKGENLLLYGENGSGKSSLCRALEVFFEHKNRSDFDKKYRNLWADQADADTSIKVDFWDENFVPPIVPVELPSNATLTWIKESQLASGFLTYRDILKTHFLEENRRNLFDLVIEILRGAVNPKSGIILVEKWAEISGAFNDLLSKRDGDFKRTEQDESGDTITLFDIIVRNVDEIKALAEGFNSEFEILIETLNIKTNEFLSIFEQNIHLKLEVNNHTYIDGRTQKGLLLEYKNLLTEGKALNDLRKQPITTEDDKFVVGEFLQYMELQKPQLTAKVDFFGRNIAQHQTFLNEARLSALAICIFLAALRLKPDPPEGCKVLFLDDVLIGLDSGNRLPLLRILKEHFHDFQVYISTYDRHWFEISKRFVSKLGNGFEWKCAELYSNEENRNGIQFIKPVLHESESSLARAHYHFKNSHRPDYPAAVNYLRKALEETIRENLPQKELKEQTGETLDKTRLLKPLLARTKTFFERIHQPTTTVDQIREKLRTLLNPLSHFEIDTPIYQNEVQKIFDLTERLTAQFKEIKPVLKEVLPQDSWVEIHFQISATETGIFRLKHKDAIYSYNSLLSNCSFWCVETYINTNGAKGNITRLRADIVDTYESIKDAYEKIYVFCQSGRYPNLANHPDYLDAVFVEDNGTIVTLKSKI